jgi:hypothetical protein
MERFGLLAARHRIAITSFRQVGRVTLSNFRLATAPLMPCSGHLAAFKSEKGGVDEFQIKSDTFQILAKVGYPIAGDIRSERPEKRPTAEQTAIARAGHFSFCVRFRSRSSGHVRLAISRRCGQRDDCELVRTVRLARPCTRCTCFPDNRACRGCGPFSRRCQRGADGARHHSATSCRTGRPPEDFGTSTAVARRSNAVTVVGGER